MTDYNTFPQLRWQEVMMVTHRVDSNTVEPMWPPWVISRFPEIACLTLWQLQITNRRKFVTVRPGNTCHHSLPTRTKFLCYLKNLDPRTVRSLVLFVAELLCCYVVVFFGVFVAKFISSLVRWLRQVARSGNSNYASQPVLFVKLIDLYTGSAWKRKPMEMMLIESFLHICLLIGWIQQNIICKKFRDLTMDWTQITCLAVSYSNHYIKMFSVFLWGCNGSLFMFGWFCPIRLFIELDGNLFILKKQTN